MNTDIEYKLVNAVHKLDAAKQIEDDAKLARLNAETRVLDLIGTLPPEGSTKRTAGDYKLTVTTSMRRKVDAKRLAEIAKGIPEAIGARLIRWKPELVTREMRFVQSNEPDIYALLSQAIEATPSKPSLKIERIEQKKEAA